MTNKEQQEKKAKQFHKLHRSGEMLLFPNVWDSLGAVLLESLDYPAIATASASIAYTNGYDDGEQLPFSKLLTLLTTIVNSVNIPVTADIESGYATNDNQLQENIKLLLATGIVGINIEDTNKETNKLIPIDMQCNRIRIIRNVADSMGISLFINARTDVYIHGEEFNTTESKLEETLKRGLAYQNAGANCLFPIAIRKEEDIKKLVDEIKIPINILVLPEVPELHMLKKMGVIRVSLGPAFLKIAIKAMKDMALKLKNLEGLSEITKNEITSDYLKELVTKK
ncbi:isocitrate lyase/phosphoenolpyruvate mutase family protein [Flavobacterium sp. GP15]|uniref:isocitrate lyase/PEP mutase family protein n=1 Tax=Flavobacterium sp. GP15 TaxID=2758567 RepID=UPI00165DB4BA|nr:isocitrate lyase/phosphoenolpyruvate mutase family protein [Flavobacterium sp. GP15]